MDAVRFGRALGFGARQAAKTVITAVDAARAQDPTKPAHGASAPSAGKVSSGTSAAPRTAPLAALHSHPDRGRPPARAAASGAATRHAAQNGRAAGPSTARVHGMRDGFNRFRESAIEPVVRLSGVLWLEVMGVFFGLFALAAANGLWRLRGELHAALVHPAAHGSAFATAAIFALFAYFCISSFMRAYRRQRRRG